MSYKYICPKCDGILNVGERIIFSVKSDTGKAGLILFNPKLGDYTIEHHPSFNVEEGEYFEFHCSVCNAELASDRHKNLARILLVDEQNNEYHILFSKIAGEKSTFKIIGDNAEIFGDDSSIYEDLISLM